MKIFLSLFLAFCVLSSSVNAKVIPRKYRCYVNGTGITEEKTKDFQGSLATYLGLGEASTGSLLSGGALVVADFKVEVQPVPALGNAIEGAYSVTISIYYDGERKKKIDFPSSETRPYSSNTAKPHIIQEALVSAKAFYFSQKPVPKVMEGWEQVRKALEESTTEPAPAHEIEQRFNALLSKLEKLKELSPQSSLKKLERIITFMEQVMQEDEGRPSKGQVILHYFEIRVFPDQSPLGYKDLESVDEVMLIQSGRHTNLQAAFKMYVPPVTGDQGFKIIRISVPEEGIQLSEDQTLILLVRGHSLTIVPLKLDQKNLNIPYTLEKLNKKWRE